MSVYKSKGAGAVRDAARKRVLVALKLYDKTGRGQLDGIVRYVKRRRSWVPKFVLTEQELESAIRDCERDPDRLPYAGFVLGALADDDQTRRVLRLSVPTVLLSKSREFAAGARAPVVIAQNDNAAIAVKAAEHLVSLGAFRAFGYVRWTSSQVWCREREAVFSELVKSRGCPVAVFSDGGAESLGDWLASLPKPAAVFAACDRRAVEVIETCADRGLAVPGQVAVIGVDDDELFCESTSPSITSIVKDDAQLGYLAARRLSALLAGGRKAGRQPIVHAYAKVVQRESTAAPSPSAHLLNRALRFIRENALRGIGIEDVVRDLGVSRRLADLRFRELAGKTMHEAIVEVRLAEVKRLLAQTDRPMADIARLSGFGSSNNLKKAFKGSVGQTMTEFRRQARN